MSKIIFQDQLYGNSQFLNVGNSRLVHAQKNPESGGILLWFQNDVESDRMGPPTAREFRMTRTLVAFPEHFDHVWTLVDEFGFATHILRADKDLS